MYMKFTFEAEIRKSFSLKLSLYIASHVCYFKQKIFQLDFIL